MSIMQGSSYRSVSRQESVRSMEPYREEERTNASEALASAADEWPLPSDIEEGDAMQSGTASPSVSRKRRLQTGLGLILASAALLKVGYGSLASPKHLRGDQVVQHSLPGEAIQESEGATGSAEQNQGLLFSDTNLAVFRGSNSTWTSTTTMSTTSSRPTTTRTMTWPLPPPSLFCVTVVRTEGYEPMLVQTQAQQEAGIFQCDAFRVYSHGSQPLQLGPVATRPIADAGSATMGDLSVSGTTTSSWLNTLVFTKMWEELANDGEWWNHDWTVKVDPDAVFFPRRLQANLASRTPFGGVRMAGLDSGIGSEPLYAGNCDRTWHGGPARLKLFGSIEIFSRNAIGSYKAFGKSCLEKLPWKGWGEDYFMQSCMNMLGAKAFNGTSLLADERCHASPCSDTTKVTFHAFKTIPEWFSCWGTSKSIEEWKEKQEQEVEERQRQQEEEEEEEEQQHSGGTLVVMKK
mmetsp:Transcript_85765/g.188308  ORF Transcript_85765/g.188308 Transcript_85765/m.188308 type:complete len:462 (+) Transcript_85765:172-1557(+)